MNQKRFINIALIVLVVVLAGAVGYFALVKKSATPTANEVKDKREHSLTVYIKAGISESQILVLKNLLENQSSIQSVQYVSANQVLSDLKAKYKDNQFFLQSLKEVGENPTGAILRVLITDSSQKQSLINLIKVNDPNFIVYRIDS